MVIDKPQPHLRICSRSYTGQLGEELRLKTTFLLHYTQVTAPLGIQDSFILDVLNTYQ